MEPTSTAASDIRSLLSRTRTVTFDCYGTLVDWKGGLSRVFIELCGDVVRSRLDELFDAYVEVEAAVQSDGFRSYRDVLGEVSVRIAERMGVTLEPAERTYLADALPDWPLFADTNEALAKLKQRYRLGILSNIDRDLFVGTARHFGVTFDFVVTAQDVNAYKPATAHFERMLGDYGSLDSTLHVAQSLFHDGAPAGAMRLPFVWINRYGQRNETDVRVAAEFPDLISLARAVDDL